MPPEQAPDPANLQAVAEPLVNDRVPLQLRLGGAAAMSVAAIAVGLLADVTARVVRARRDPSHSARRGNRTTVKEGSS